MTLTIEQIAGAHLGKAGDGSAVKPYVTPDSIDSTLLVPIPRHLNRTVYGLDDANLPFVGHDVWNCYEVSFLLANGMPVSGAVKLSYSSNSESIVESKSLKLYLNSFNMEKFDTLNKDYAVVQLEERIRTDLAAALNTGTVKTQFYDGDKQKNYQNDFFTKLETSVDYRSLSFTHYKESPDILQFREDDGTKALAVRSSLLRSNCRVTNQPDWGDIYIFVEGESLPTPESVLQYIVSLRSENHFHEEICECVYKRLHDKFAPRNLAVACFYTRRGGIDINPIRASSKEMEKSLFGDYANLSKIVKTVRQ